MSLGLDDLTRFFIVGRQRSAFEWDISGALCRSLFELVTNFPLEEKMNRLDFVWGKSLIFSLNNLHTNMANFDTDGADECVCEKFEASGSSLVLLLMNFTRI